MMITESIAVSKGKKEADRPMSFKEQLIRLRKQRGLSQEQLGQHIGVSRQTVSKWELGDTTPELEKLIQISRFFDISIDTLVGNEDEKNAASQESKTGKSERAGSLEKVSCLRIDGQSSTGEKSKPSSLDWHYEYKSEKKIGGLPLIHVNIGRRPRKAKGIIAVGGIAQGVVAIGAVSFGLLSLGAVSLGILSLGCAALGLLTAVGGIAAGSLAMGGLAIGILAFGGQAVGIYAIGGSALGAHIAAGALAHAPVAVGDQISGDLLFDIHNHIADGEIADAILSRFPKTPAIIVKLFEMIS